MQAEATAKENPRPEPRCGGAEDLRDVDARGRSTSEGISRGASQPRVFRDHGVADRGRSMHLAQPRRNSLEHIAMTTRRRPSGLVREDREVNCLPPQISTRALGVHAQAGISAGPARLRGAGDPRRDLRSACYGLGVDFGRVQSHIASRRSGSRSRARACRCSSAIGGRAGWCWSRLRPAHGRLARGGGPVLARGRRLASPPDSPA